MNFNNSSLKEKLLSHKKSAVILVVGALGILVLGIGAVFIYVFTSGLFTSSTNISSVQSLNNETVLSASNSQLSYQDSIVLNWATNWVQQNLSSQEAASVSLALSCVESLGGPSPEKILLHIKTQVTDANVLQYVDEIGASLAKIDQSASGANSCFNWMISG